MGDHQPVRNRQLSPGTVLKKIPAISMTLPIDKYTGRTGSGHLSMNCFEIHMVLSYHEGPSEHWILQRSVNNFLSHCLLNFCAKGG